MFHPTDVHIGRRIRERRVELGMSQSALAEQLGITFQQVQKYERGGNRVSGSRLWDISRVLGVNVSHFFEGLQEQPNAAAQEDSMPLTRQSLEVARAINSIPEGEVKSQIVKLVKTFAKSA
ncbi:MULTISPECIES: helix-turn-helix domain-containing protein [Aquibaculum]|uniref:Helix-turn-helix transcriptional regulator n=1 Tax=Aquibaculum arenosum TaxID=3032591 RepID=A0ABT5YKH5_9PROT|nr:helix-turn-helix transcriptional regulator [Fodinicurvata sp. CAU 1616]MDF2095451.1 helix-turn-helix transcriptional regulator [Fodinicurvata sp. CAU 1616]